MPKLPVLSGADIIGALERLGIERVRQRGSHVALRHGEIGCVVPLHKEAKAGTLAGILRQAQTTQDDFVDAATMK